MIQQALNLKHTDSLLVCQYLYFPVHVKVTDYISNCQDVCLKEQLTTQWKSCFFATSNDYISPLVAVTRMLGWNKTQILDVGDLFNQISKTDFQPVRVISDLIHLFLPVEYNNQLCVTVREVDIRDLQDYNSAHLVFTVFYVVHRHAIISTTCRYVLEMYFI